jgi:hypothetical protein
LLISSFQGGKTPDERRASIRFKRFESAFFARFQERVSTERSHYNVFRGDASRAFFKFSPSKFPFCDGRRVPVKFSGKQRVFKRFPRSAPSCQTPREG